MRHIPQSRRRTSAVCRLHVVHWSRSSDLHAVALSRDAPERKLRESRYIDDLMDDMDRLILELCFAQAEEDVLSSAYIVKEQRNRIVALERIGGDCAEERELLAFLERVEAAHAVRHDTLRHRLGS